jgi:hypothetical protein
MQTRWILKRLDLDPFGLRHLRRSGQAGPSNDNFVMNFIGDINTREDPVEEVEAAKLGQNNKRR